MLIKVRNNHLTCAVVSFLSDRLVLWFLLLLFSSAVVRDRDSGLVRGSLLPAADHPHHQRAPEAPQQRGHVEQENKGTPTISMSTSGAVGIRHEFEIVWALQLELNCLLFFL